MKIATSPLNGIPGRLPPPLAWLDEARPDVACLPELEASVPHPALAQLGYAALWHGHDDSANDHASVWVQAR